MDSTTNLTALHPVVPVRMRRGSALPAIVGVLGTALPFAGSAAGGTGGDGATAPPRGLV